MGDALSETYARNPHFYSGTFCVGCQKHFPVGVDGEFVWSDDGEPVGLDAEEAAEWNKKKVERKKAQESK